MTVSSASLEAACTSQALPGEELPGDRKFARERRKRTLPKLLDEGDKKSTVESWLDTTVVDPVSQPSANQAASSTPSLASQAPAILSLPLSPLSSNTPLSRQSPRKVKGKNCIGSPSVDVFSQLPPSQVSVQVDVDDTFDKLLAGHNKRVAPAPLIREENVPIFSQQLFSPLNSTPPPLLSPSTSKSILEAVCSPQQSDQKKKTRQFMRKSLAKHVEEMQAEMPKKTRGQGKRVSWQEDLGENKESGSGGDGDMIELESFSKVDNIKGITPTERQGGKRNTKYPRLSLVATKGNSLKKAPSEENLVVEEIHEDLFIKDVPAEGNLKSTKAACSLDRVSETDSQATISSVNAKAGCDQSTALTDSIPSEISNSQTSAWEPQVKHYIPQTKCG